MLGIHGAKMIMPGPGAQPVNMTGNVLDRDKFKEILKEFYELVKVSILRVRPHLYLTKMK